MERLLSRSTTPTDKPEWLVKLQHATNQAFSSRGVEDTTEEWQQLKDFVDWFISKLYMRRDIKIRSNISTRIVKKDGQTELHIKRNGKTIQIFYIQKTIEDYDYNFRRN